MHTCRMYTVSGQFIRYIRLVPGQTPLCLQNSQNSLVHGYVPQLVSRDLTYARNHSPHHYTTATSLYCWHQAGWAMASCCLHQILPLPQNDATGTWIRWIRQCFSTPQLSSVGDGVAHWSHFCLFLVDRSGTWCGRLLQQPICDKDGWVVRSEMPFCAIICLFVAHLLACTILFILLRPLINELFSRRGLPQAGCFLFPAPLSVYFIDNCRARKAQDQPLLKYWNRHTLHQQSYHAQSCLGHSFCPF
jgi:hypothetical protein